MKKIILCAFSAMFSLINLTFAQIPNNGFENWTNMGSYVNPDGWGTMNNITAIGSVYTAEKGTPGNPGNAYLSLSSKTVNGSIVNGIAVSGKLDSITMQPISGFAFNQRPQTFTGNYQHMIYGSSQGSISVKLTRWNTATGSRETIATANKTLSGMAMSWSSFTINFIYQNVNVPDTCIIVLKASGNTPAEYDYLFVDNLAFAGIATGVKEQSNFLNKIEVYPNPTSQNIIVNINLKSYGQTTYELIDLTGKIVLSKTAALPQGESTQTFNISEFAKGAYFIKIKANGENVTRKIIID